MSNEAKIVIKSLTGEDKPFVVPVEVVTLAGDAAVINFKGIARNRSDWLPIANEMMNSRLEKAKKALEEAPVDDPDVKPETAEQVRALRKKRVKELTEMQKRDLAKEYKGTVDDQIEEALKVASGWELDDPFTKANLALVEAKYPGCLVALVDKYGRVVNGERVKNS